MIEQLAYFNKLKEVERVAEVGKEGEGRKETVAEHLFSMSILLEYFKKTMTIDLNWEKCQKMIWYHDIPEIVAKDTFILDEEAAKTKVEREAEGMREVLRNIPEVLRSEAEEVWKEYEANETQEANLAQAIDAIDGVLQNIYRPDLWKKHGFTEEILRKYKEKYTNAFPETKQLFEDLILYLKENKIL